MNKKFPFLSLIFILSLYSCNSKFSKLLENKDYDLKYKKAEGYYVKKDYLHAQLLFENIAHYFKGTNNYEDLYYKLAYSYFYQGDYLNAENLFKTFTETFPTSIHAEECDFMRANCYYKQSPKLELDQSNTNKAMSLLQAFINNHPESKRNPEANVLIDKCREKLELKDLQAARLYYDLSYYKAASICYESLVENYPDSKNVEEYKLQCINSYYKFAFYSFDNKQTERYTKVNSLCVDFLQQFPKSKYSSQVLETKQKIINKIN